MENVFTSQKDLFNKVRPALNTKKSELDLNGIKYVTVNDIWKYNIENNWKDAKGLTLAKIVNDILNTEDKKYSEYALKKINNKED